MKTEGGGIKWGRGEGARGREGEGRIVPDCTASGRRAGVRKEKVALSAWRNSHLISHELPEKCKCILLQP